MYMNNFNQIPQNILSYSVRRMKSVNNEINGGVGISKRV